MQWRELYESCVFETNREGLEGPVFNAEDAIYLGSRELSKESRIANELKALRQAVRGSPENRIRTLGWPDLVTVDAKN